MISTQVTPEELRAAQEKHDAYLAKWKRLRRVVMDACARVGEACGDDVDLAHLAGVFTDEEAGVRAAPEALLSTAPSSSSAPAPRPVVTKKKLGVRKRARA